LPAGPSCPQGLLHADAVDRADKLEKIALDLAQKTDQPGRQAAVSRIAFQIINCVQADILPHAAL
jgi:hypothetical protein